MAEKKLDRICILCAVLAVALTVGLIALGLGRQESGMETVSAAEFSTDYAGLLFDNSYVHVIDIRTPRVNWDYMVRNAEEEQYVYCDVIIDGETISEAAIRPKGNSSLSAIRFQNSDRFSFKIEFDHYHAGSSYHGLDKLSLNNLGQDVSCMKDYLVYQMMNEAGVPAPLSSYALVRLNGEDFGLYLAVEAVEDAFAYRNYGSNAGNLYKPECFAVGGLSAMATTDEAALPKIPDYSAAGPGDRVDLLGSVVRAPFEYAFGAEMDAAALKYLGQEEEPYAVIFDSAVFDLTEESRASYIRTVKTLSESPAEAVDAEAVTAYFAVHNFVNNYDSYTGVFDHNYYLREADGKLSLIPWDYNLAFGVFTLESAGRSILGPDSGYEMGPLVEQAMDDKTNMVNYPIDDPTFTVALEDRPLIAAVLGDEGLKESYHARLQALLTDFFDSGRFEELFSRSKALIEPYVEAGLTFYRYERFETASQAIHDYCVLRAESIRRQLSGQLPATMEGQRRDYAGLVDASGLDLASSVTYDGMLFGIRSEDVTAVLDALAGEHSHDMAGLTEAVSEMAEEPSQIGPAIGRVFAASSILQGLVLRAISGPVLLAGAMILLLIARKRVKKYRRRRESHAVQT